MMRLLTTYILVAIVAAANAARADDIGAIIADCQLKYPNRDAESKDQMLLCMRTKGYVFPEFKTLSREEYNSSIWKAAGMNFEEAQNDFKWTENLCYYDHDDPKAYTEFCYTKAKP